MERDMWIGIVYIHLTTRLPALEEEDDESKYIYIDIEHKHNISNTEHKCKISKGWKKFFRVMRI